MRPPPVTASVSSRLNEKLLDTRLRWRLVGPFVLAEHLDPKTVTNVARIEASKSVVKPEFPVSACVERMTDRLPAGSVLDLELNELPTGWDSGRQMPNPPFERDSMALRHFAS